MTNDKELMTTVSIQDYLLAKKILGNIDRGNAKESAVALFMAGGRHYWDGCVGVFEQAAEELNIVPEDIASIAIYTDGTAKAQVITEALNGGEIQ